MRNGVLVTLSSINKHICSQNQLPAPILYRLRFGCERLLETPTKVQMLEVLQDCPVREHFVCCYRLDIDNPLIECKIAFFLLDWPNSISPLLALPFLSNHF
jgi:hypothetical protein